VSLKAFRPSVIALCLFALVSVHGAIPPAEDLLPADTLFVFTVPDYTTLKKTAGQSPQWLFWTDPAMKRFHDHFMGKWNDSFATPLERDLGINLDDFAELPQGQLTFAVTQNGWNGADQHSPGVLLLLDAREKAGLLKTNIAALQKKWLDDGKPIRTETIRGVSFSIVTVSSNDVPAALRKMFPRRPPVRELGREPQPEKPGELVIGQYGSMLIAGNSIDAVAPVVAHLTGSAMPALDDNVTFASDKLSRFHDAPLYFAWLNTRTVFDILSHLPPDAPNPRAPTVFPPIQLGKVFGAIGLAGATSVSLAYHQNHDGALLDLFLASPETDRSGLLKVFSTESKSASPPVFVPVDVAKCWRWRVDGARSWDELQKLMDDILPGGMSALNGALDAANAVGRQQAPGFDVRRYLFENLGDDFISYQKLPAPGGDPKNAPSLFLLGVRDGDRASFAIQSFMGFAARSAQKGTEPRNFQGHTIFTIPLPSRSTGAGAPSQRYLYCAAAGDYVALTGDVSMIEEYLRSPGNPPAPLNGKPGLLDAAQHVGGAGNGVFGYENNRETLRSLFLRLKNKPGGSFISSPFIQAPKETDDWMDFSLLPDYDRVAKYFYFSVYAGTTTTAGMEFKFFAPRPPELK